MKPVFMVIIIGDRVGGSQSLHWLGGQGLLTGGSDDFEKETTAIGNNSWASDLILPLKV